MRRQLAVLAVCPVLTEMEAVFFSCFALTSGFGLPVLFLAIAPVFSLHLLLTEGQLEPDRPINLFLVKKEDEEDWNQIWTKKKDHWYISCC